MSIYGFNNPADESSITTAGFLNQLKEVDNSLLRSGFGNDKPRRDKVLEGSPLKNEKELKQQENILEGNFLDITISKQRYCSKETVKGNKHHKGKKFGSRKNSVRNNMGHGSKKAVRKNSQVSLKTSNLLQAKKRGTSLKDFLNTVDKDHNITGLKSPTTGHQRKELLKNIMISQKKPTHGTTSILDDIMSNTTMHSPKKTFTLESISNINSNQGSAKQSKGGFLDQMKKDHQNTKTSLFGTKSIIARKKKSNLMGFQSHINSVKNKKTSLINISDEVYSAKIMDTKSPKMNDAKQQKKSSYNFQQQRKPIVVKNTIIHKKASLKLGLNQKERSANEPLKSSRKIQTPANKPGKKGFFSKKNSLSRAGSTNLSGSNTARTNGSQTDRNSKKPKRRMSSSGPLKDHRSRSKNQKTGGNKYKIKTFNDFLTSSNISKM